MTDNIWNNPPSPHLPELRTLKEEYDDIFVLPYDKEVIFNPLVDKEQHEIRYSQWKQWVSNLNKAEYKKFMHRLQELNDRITAFMQSKQEGTVQH